MINTGLQKRPFSHPLYGSSLSNLIRLLIINHPVSLKYTPQLLTALGSALVRWPLSVMEDLIYSKKISNLQDITPPIFVVGHWRSGTTHLSNILSQSPDFGFVSPVAAGIPHDLLLIGRMFRGWLEKSIPPNRLIDSVRVGAASPQEDEFGLANMLPVSFLHGLYFPKKFEENFLRGVFFDGCSAQEIEAWAKISVYYLKKIYIDQGYRQLLVRNPAYSVRIPLLKTLWPGAKFIHIYRNPYRVFPSMQNYFQKLLPALALQDYRKVKVDEFILTTYARMMDQLLLHTSTLSDSEYLEIRYEDMENAPMSMIKKIYDRFQLPSFPQQRPHFEQYLRSISSYTKNKYQPTPGETATVSSHWRRFIDHWGY